MNGVSHKTIGVGIAIACVYVGMKQNNAALCAAAVTAPLGAMLPDIDHDNSKIGKKRKEGMETIEKAGKVGIAGVILGTVGYQIYLTGAIATALFKVSLMWIPILLCLKIATSETIKSKLKFFTKHRGIMHTLWPVIGMLYGSYIIKIGFIQSLIMGLALGYLSHLLADCETIMGCPILWPIVKGNIRILKVRTGTAWEKIIMLLDLVAIGLIAMLLSKR